MASLEHLLAIRNKQASGCKSPSYDMSILECNRVLMVHMPHSSGSVVAYFKATVQYC